MALAHCSTYWFGSLKCLKIRSICHVVLLCHIWFLVCFVNGYMLVIILGSYFSFCISVHVSTLFFVQRKSYIFIQNLINMCIHFTEISWALILIQDSGKKFPVHKLRCSTSQDQLTTISWLVLDPWKIHFPRSYCLIKCVPFTAREPFCLLWKLDYLFAP